MAQVCSDVVELVLSNTHNLHSDNDEQRHQTTVQLYKAAKHKTTHVLQMTVGTGITTIR